MKVKENFFEDSRRRFAVVCALLMGVSCLYHGLVLHTFSHWWFEDDACLLAVVRDAGGPLSFFWDRNLLIQFNGTVPLQILSFWIDNTLGYRSITFAHLHQLVSLAITLVLLFYVLRGFGLSDRDALILDLLWLCLPAVIAVNEFISARHYLEGFACSLGAVLVAQKIGQGRWRQTSSTFAFLFVMLAGGALFKELYAITVPLFVFFYLYSYRRNVAAAIALLLIPIYGLYRLWAIGSGLTWHMPLVGGRAYLEFLGRLPYIFAGDAGGYVLILGFALLCLWRFRSINLRIAGCALLVLCSALATIYPTTFAISRDWLVHGTWYRVMFFVSTIILLGGGYWLGKTQTRSMRAVALVLSALILIFGAGTTAQKWQRAMDRYRFEGKYYLAHEDQLIYSEVPAFWYLRGIHDLYAVPISHHVDFTARKKPLPAELSTFKTIWRYQSGKFVEDRALFEELERNK